jgi:hypothetical protein
MTITTTSTPSTSTSNAFTSFVLASMRCARIRAQIVVNEITTAGVALKAGLIDPDTALSMLGEAGLLPLVEPSS